MIAEGHGVVLGASLLLEASPDDDEATERGWGHPAERKVLVFGD